MPWACLSVKLVHLYTPLFFTTQSSTSWDWKKLFNIVFTTLLTSLWYNVFVLSSGASLFQVKAKSIWNCWNRSWLWKTRRFTSLATERPRWLYAVELRWVFMAVEAFLQNGSILWHGKSIFPLSWCLKLGALTCHIQSVVPTELTFSESNANKIAKPNNRYSEVSSSALTGPAVSTHWSCVLCHIACNSST